MRSSFISLLHCPFSGSEFALRLNAENGDAVGYGVVTSEAGSFPIVDGILRLLLDDLREPLVQMIDAGRYEQALLTSLEVPHRERGGAWVNLAGRAAYYAGLEGAGERIMALKRSLYRVLTDPNKTFTQTIDNLSRGQWREWQAYRFSMRTFLPVLPMVELLHKGPLLDFGCGLGHAAFLMAKNVPGKEITGVDYSFSSLYLARKFFLPDGNFVCLDGDYPLPFEDGYFQGVFSTDALHCIESKVALSRELVRVLAETGAIVMPHLHNKLSPVKFGKSLSPGAYKRLFQPLECRVFAESEIVRRYLKHGELDLTQGGVGEDFSSEGLSLVASNDAAVFRRYAGLGDNYVGRMKNPVLNPAYHVVEAVDHWELTKVTSATCAESLPVEDEVFLPERWLVPRAPLTSLKSLRDIDKATIATLAHKLIVLDAPAQYV